jgi:1-acyl-sn-glycerol-3-phosphate acyltransferase
MPADEPASLPRRAREGARQALRTAGFLGVTALVAAPFSVHMQRTRRTGQARVEARDAWVKAWARAQLGLFGVEVVVDGLLPPPTRQGEQGRLLVANHRSAADIGVILGTFGGTMVSRADLATWPVLGRGAQAADTIFVDRELPQSGAVTLRTMQRRLAEGNTVCIFPEGTTLDGDEVRPFHRGGFVAALGAKAEVLPVGLAYPAAAKAAFTEAKFRDHLSRIARGPGFRVAVAVGAPLAPAPGERAAAYAERAQAAVQACVARARAVVGP